MPSLIDCLKAARTTIGDTYDLDEEILENIYEIFVKECKPIIDAKPVKAVKASKKSSDSKPSKPRAKTAYNLYVKHQFALSKDTPAKEGEVSNSQTRMTTFSSQWAKLSEEDKKPYVQMAQEANAAAAAALSEDDEHADGVAGSAETTDAPATKDTKAAKTTTSKTKASKTKDDAPEKPKREKKEKDPNAKKRVTGYNLFYSVNKDRIKSELQKGEKIMQVVGAAWKDLSDDERQDYNERAKAQNGSDSDASQAE